MKLKARKKLVKIFKKFEERFDIIKLDKGISKEFQSELDREGIVIYEKI